MRNKQNQNQTTDFKGGFIACTCMCLLIILICLADTQGIECSGTVTATRQERIVNETHYYIQVDIEGEVEIIEVARPEYDIGDIVEIRCSALSRKYEVK